VLWILTHSAGSAFALPSSAQEKIGRVKQPTGIR